MPRPKASQRTKPMLKDRDRLDEIHDKWQYAQDRWASIRKEAKEDMKHVLNDPWPELERAEREKNSRPVVATDEISQYQNQVINDLRLNPRALAFAPDGDGADEAMARFLGNKARQIEYESDASAAYDQATECAIQRSYGYVKLTTIYESDTPRSATEPGSAFDQQFRIEAIADPDCVWPDPDFTSRVGKDWRWLFEVESRATEDFLREFPDAEVRNFTPELIKYASGWITNERVQLAQFWDVQQESRKILGLYATDPATQQRTTIELWEDEQEAVLEGLRARGLILEPGKEREVKRPVVSQTLTNGVEIVRQTPWIGKWIPYVPVFGRLIWADRGTGPELVILSMTRFARLPNLLLAYYTSTEAELVGMTPKIPYFVWEGSLSRQMAQKLAQANKVPVPYIEVKPKLQTTQQDTPSLPTRQEWNPPIQGVEIGKENARRSIQAAMGLVYLPSAAQRRSEKSGVALKQIEESGQRGAYHWRDARKALIRRVGELLEDGIPKLYDTARWTMVRDAKGVTSAMYINGDGARPDGVKDEQVLARLTGRFSVTIDEGPAYESEQERAQAFVDQFLGSAFFQSLPPPMQVQIGAMLIKLQNLGPIGQDIIDVLQPKAGQGQQPEQIIAQLQAALKQGEGIVRAYQGRIQELEAERAAKVVETQGKLAVESQRTARDVALEGMREQGEERRSQRDADVAVQIQEMKDRIALLELHLRAGVEGNKLAQDTAMPERARQHQDRQMGPMMPRRDRRMPPKEM